jgi:hypothetical protein
LKYANNNSDRDNARRANSIRAGGQRDELHVNDKNAAGETRYKPAEVIDLSSDTEDT